MVSGSLFSQTPRIDAALIGYCIAVQVRTMMRSLICNINYRMGENILRRVLVMPCSVLLMDHLMSGRRIVMIGNGRGGVDGLGDVL